jgi:hypothetical protein
VGEALRIRHPSWTVFLGAWLAPLSPVFWLPFPVIVLRVDRLGDAAVVLWSLIPCSIFALLVFAYVRFTIRFFAGLGAPPEADEDEAGSTNA